MDTQRDIILVLTGGVMQGVFGGGVVTAFQEANLYPRIHSIYSASAGAHNAAYFLSRQTRMGSSIYFEDLTSRQFIHTERLIGFLGDCVRRLWNRSAPVRPLADLDYLVDSVEQQQKPLDLETIRQQPIDWQVHGFDVRTHRHLWLDGKRDTMTVLKATATASPFYPYSVSCQGHAIIDASVIRSRRLLDVAGQHPDKTIIYVRNKRRTWWGNFCELPNRLLEAVLLWVLFDWHVAWLKVWTTFRFPSARTITQYPNVIFAENNIPGRVLETDPRELQRIYDHGMAAGQGVLAQLS